MKTKVGKQGADELYQAWIKGTPVKDLVEDFDISRQRIYQILHQHKSISKEDKMLRAVNKLAVTSKSSLGEVRRKRGLEEESESSGNHLGLLAKLKARVFGGPSNHPKNKMKSTGSGQIHNEHPTQN